MLLVGRMAEFMLILVIMIYGTSVACSSACSGVECLLPRDYDRRRLPKQGKPLEITMSIFVESFGDVDVAKMQFETFGYISQTWTDSRLAKLDTTPIVLEGSDTHLIWLPDLYCINCKVSNLDNGINSKQSMASIDTNGTVHLSFMVVTVASCMMDLHQFPFDLQQCSLQFSSYAYNSSKILYRWGRKPIVQTKLLDQFFVTGEQAMTHVGKYFLGNFTISGASFKFERRVGFYILQLYIPTTMLVCLSWTMFCLNHNHAGERITIGVTLFLTMIFINGQANVSLPKVSYIKSIDIFIVVSLAEILLIIIESIIVTKLIVKREKEMTCKNSRKKSSLEPNTKNCQTEGTVIVCDSADKGVEISGKTGTDRKIPEEGQNIAEWMPILVKGVDTSKPLRANGKVGECSKNGLEKSTGANPLLSKWSMHRSIEKSSLVLFPLSYIAFSIWYWETYFQNRKMMS